MIRATDKIRKELKESIIEIIENGVKEGKTNLERLEDAKYCLEKEQLSLRQLVTAKESVIAELS